MTIYTEIPYVPEDTLDPAAGLNEALRVIRALTQTCVLSKILTAPPGSPANGDKYLVANGATGAWEDMDDYLAEYVSDGAHWDFFAPGILANSVVNLDDGKAYYYNAGDSPTGWVQVAT